MKKLLCVLLSLVLVFGLVACGGKESTDDAASGEARTDVVVGMNVSLDSLDPMNALQRDEQYILANTHDTLIELINGSYVGELAESFEVADDGMSITVKLVEGVTFHNGDPLTTEDIAYTYDSMKNSTLHADSANYYSHTEIIDDYNCVIHAAVPTPMFMLTLATVDVVNEKATNELGDEYNLHPVGTGPYKFVSYDGFNNIVVEANEDYFKGAPEIKKINYRIFSDEQTMCMALEAGEIDLIGVVSPTAAMQSEGNDKYTVTWKEADGVNMILFNVNCAPFDKVEVRQAISYAIDRDAINLIVGEGKCTVRDAFYSDKMAAHPDYEDLPHYTYDQAKAKELLAAAGLPDGFTLEEPVRITADFEKMAVTLQQQLAEVGINFEIEVLESNTLFNNYLFVGKYNMMPFSLSTELYDMAYVCQFYHGPVEGGMPSLTGYDNPVVNEKIDAANALLSDIEARKAAYTELWSIFAEDLPICPIMGKVVAEVQVSNLVDDDTVLTEVKGENLHWK